LVAFLDELAFLERNLIDLAIDAGSHSDGVETLHRSKTDEINREVFLRHRCHSDGNTWRRSFHGFIAARMLRPHGINTAGDQHRREKIHPARNATFRHSSLNCLLHQPGSS
jgi:hypothetical protein